MWKASRRLIPTTHQRTASFTSQFFSPLKSNFNQTLFSLKGPRSIRAVYIAAVDFLQDREVPEADISARYLLSKVTDVGYSPADFSDSLDKQLTDSQAKQFISFIERRAHREPVQYIIGDWDFYGLTFLCQAPVLIPRPETEELVDLVLESLEAGSSEHRKQYPWRILDIGAGTGVLGIALLSALPSASCTAIDIDPAAVSLAKVNANKLLLASTSVPSAGIDPSHCRYKVLHCSLQEFASRPDEQGQYDLVVSNPPYIPSSELETLEPEVVQFESRLALDGGQAGLDLIRDILRLTPPLFRSSPTLGCAANELWMEVHHTQHSLIKDLIKNKYTTSHACAGSSGEGRNDVTRCFNNFEQFVDFRGQPRFAKCVIK